MAFSTDLLTGHGGGRRAPDKAAGTEGGRGGKGREKDRWMKAEAAAAAVKGTKAATTVKSDGN